MDRVKLDTGIGKVNSKLDYQMRFQKEAPQKPKNTNRKTAIDDGAGEGYSTEEEIF